MNLQKITRKTRILPVVVFCAAFAVLTFATHLLYQNQAKDEQLRAVYTAESTVGRVSSQLNQYLSESNFIKKLIESGYDISGRPFAAISGHMQEGKDIIKAHELAKDVIVSQVYPILENQAAIGLDMLENPARKKEATLAKESGEYTIAGPFELAQGGTLDGYRERTHMVVEGALACKTLKTLSEAYDVELPITDVVRSVVWEGADPKAAAKDLFARPLTTEFYGL